MPLLYWKVTAHIPLPPPVAVLPPAPINQGMIAPGNHCYLKIRCALQHPPGEGIAAYGRCRPNGATSLVSNKR